MKLLESYFTLVFRICSDVCGQYKAGEYNRLEDTDVQKRTRRRIKWKDCNDPSFPPDTLPSLCYRKYDKLNIWPPFNFITQSCYTWMYFHPDFVSHWIYASSLSFSFARIFPSPANVIRRNLIHLIYIWLLLFTFDRRNVSIITD